MKKHNVSARSFPATAAAIAIAEASFVLGQSLAQDQAPFCSCTQQSLGHTCLMQDSKKHCDSEVERNPHG